MPLQTAKRGGNRGSALLWAVIVLAVMVVFVGASLAVASSYHKRSLDQKTQRQAYFTARSVASAVADIIAGGTGQHLVPENAGDSRADVPVSVQLNDGNMAQLGSYSVDIARPSESALTVTATATVGGQTATYRAELVQDYKEVIGFGRGLCVDGFAGDALLKIKTVHGDLYTAASGQLTIDFPVSGNLFAPNADVLVTPNGSVAGTVVARNCSYNNVLVKPYQVVAVGSASGVDERSLVKIPAADMAKIFQKPEVVLPKGYKESDFKSATVLAPPEGQDPDAETVYTVEAGSYYTLADGVDELRLAGSGDGLICILIAGREVALTAADFGGAEVCFILKDGAKLTDRAGEKNGAFHVLCTDGSGSVYAVASAADGAATDVVMEGNLFVSSFEAGSGCSLTVNGPDPGAALPSYLIPNGWRLAKYTEGAD